MANADSSSNQHALQVNLAERSYKIHIGQGCLQQIGARLNEVMGRTRHAVVMFDENVESFADQIFEQLVRAEWRASPIRVASGEKSKSVAEAGRIWNEMLAAHTDRGSAVIAVGGGVVGDLAGFMAATFARGIPLVQVPTTLLSQVDSSVGGKTGINLPGAKNIVGAFWQPSLVLIDSATLETLPQREYISGLAEVAKYGMILLPDLFEYLEQNAEAVLAKDPTTVSNIIEQSCRAKAMVVEEDERETSGRRATLNYGHTFGHALESVTRYGKLLHGEAVSIGMHMAATMAAQMGRIESELVARQASLLKRLQLPTQYPDADPQEMWEIMQHDKKVEHGKLRFILPTRLGHVELVEGIERSQAIHAIQAANA